MHIAPVDAPWRNWGTDGSSSGGGSEGGGESGGEEEAPDPTV